MISAPWYKTPVQTTDFFNSFNPFPYPPDLTRIQMDFCVGQISRRSRCTDKKGLAYPWHGAQLGRAHGGIFAVLLREQVDGGVDSEVRHHSALPPTTIRATWSRPYQQRVSSVRVSLSERPGSSYPADAVAVPVRLFFPLRECGRRQLCLLYQSGLLIFSVYEVNMTLKPILILGLSVLLASTECGNHAGNTRRVPFFTLTTT